MIILRVNRQHCVGAVTVVKLFLDVYIHRIEHDKLRLLAHDGVAPATAELGDPVAAAGEDADKGDESCDQKCPEARIAGQGEAGRRPVVAVTADGDEIVAGQTCENDERGDLKGQTGNHDVDAIIQKTLCGRHSGQSTPSALQEDADDITSNEDPSIQLRTQTRVAGPKSETKMLEQEIDAGVHEGRGEGEQNHRQLESEVAEGIIVQHDTGDVADAFEGAAEGEDDGEGEPGAAVEDCLGGVGEGAEGEEDGEEEGGGQAGCVAVWSMSDGEWAVEKGETYRLSMMRDMCLWYKVLRHCRV